MIRDAPNINYLFAELLIEELVRHGVEWFVISPGSRSAPLAWTAASHPRAKTVVHFDERGAAFHALGIAKATLKPAAFICTSGTATANALPAAVEASYSGIPLVLITADRPERLQGSGANQTINQHGLYREFVRDEKNFSVSIEDFDAAAVLTAIDEAVYCATEMWPGPVHLNCQFDEPLAPNSADGVPFDWSGPLTNVSDWLDGSATITARAEPKKSIARVEMSAVMDAIERAKHGVVVVGQLPSRGERRNAQGIVMKLGWPGVTDATSGLSLNINGTSHHALHMLDFIFEKADVVLQFGGAITSRRLLDALAKFPVGRDPSHAYIRVSPNPAALDPFGNITHRIFSDPPTFHIEFDEAVKERAKTVSILGQILERQSRDEDSARRRLEIFPILQSVCADEAPVTEPSVAMLSVITQRTSDIVFLGNSMPVRDVDLYATMSGQAPHVLANRGASGIDGNIATAAGAARAVARPTTALIGDLAALHDLNSLSLLRDIGTPFVLVIVNNNGGGIFHFLPIAQHTQHFERLFGTPHFLNFEAAAEMFGLPYHQPKTNGEFRRVRETALERNGATIVEVRTDRAENLRLHRELDAKIRAAMSSPTSSPG